MDIVLNNVPAIADTGSGSFFLDGAGTTLNSARLIERDVSDLHRVTCDISASVAVPLVGAPNGYTQTRRNILLKLPEVLDNGNTTVNTIRFAMAVDAEMNNSEKTLYVERLHQLLIALLANDFLTNGSFA